MEIYIGYTARDSVSIAGLDIEKYAYQEYTEMRQGLVLAINWGFDGLLGLTPPWNTDSIGYPTYTSRLLQQDNLEEKVFSTKFPRFLHEEGEFMVGDSNSDLYTGEFRTIKALDDAEGPGTYEGRWNVPISSITLNTSLPLRLPTPNCTAVLLSEAILALPRQFVQNFTEIIGAEPFSWWWQTVPCDRRAYLPELTFEIGGHNFSINAFDYTFEWEVPRDGYGIMCVLAVEGGEMDGNDCIGLGTPFLKGFYERFDLKERTIGFAELKR
ncbi:aspartic peptidase domain-containing protein [Massariosphaeria phaeospora]|uniref:Aspartic peptidase domain-containing protein n=1 Tax=Massariosphaeria phaeospora TaxID=100035 RepID=A0A7C8I0X5_9PLEO|nr:aspartic peptidase domain-containing protein [Massariosphaeria phaeospora]